MRRLSGLPRGEIASGLGIPTSAVETHICRTAGHLRRGCEQVAIGFRRSCRLSPRVAAILVSAVAGSAEAQTQLLWGDTHVHSSYSFDAYGYGNTTIDPDAAYRFARGDPIAHPGTGELVRLERPLDFLVVADHAELLGLARRAARGDADVAARPFLRQVLNLIAAGELTAARDLLFSLFGTRDRVLRQDLLRNPRLLSRSWADVVDAADRNNRPGRFTALVGWEWSGGLDRATREERTTLHRVIFTSAGGTAAKSFNPFTAFDSERPEHLWAWLEATQRATGAAFVAIPHNPNLSSGQMFAAVDSNGQAITRSYAATRARWEPVVEITQSKGTSETHPALSPNDEFADFEIYRGLGVSPRPSQAEYVRSALMRGLEIEARVGANPYKFGLVGSTDVHTGLSSTNERAFLGVLASAATPAQRREGPFSLGWHMSASGRAGVWATANTREAILAAFRRREVYATTGPRIAVRVFGGFDFTPADAGARDLARVGYRKGVPMGGQLWTAPANRALTLLIHAVKDPSEANLDRVQVVKVWLDRDGAAHERIYDAVWSRRRGGEPSDRPSALRDIVDLWTATGRADVGSAQLSTVWRDPDFDPGRRALYYVRVLQVPTPRNSLVDAIALGIDPEETGYPATLQERAFSSPIWFSPA